MDCAALAGKKVEGRLGVERLDGEDGVEVDVNWEVRWVVVSGLRSEEVEPEEYMVSEGLRRGKRRCREKKVLCMLTRASFFEA